ncbi:MAG: flavodoxin domain-containing protein [candidate division KSB1 bacterium]|nr:flavodoxin domain-containing protein [candidate division KSB1 bacterium]MDZ7295715.1 flavodoxin domain-containing protein [candidate division KSB1 bacterium]MDZ7391378.1 flavodoxin domain-containing protein [candidate division KSB1 bacterium]
MKVLIVYGSKYGATAAIAQRIAGVLAEEGLQVAVLRADGVKDLRPYGAAIVGSAVYAGQWRKEVVSFVRAHAEELSHIPVWCFSSGPLGSGDPVELLHGWRIPKALESTLQRVRPRGIAVFHGALDVTKLNWFERAIVRLLKSPRGDFRDWEAIAAWARDIALALKG